MPCTYLAHHELESVIIAVVNIMQVALRRFCPALLTSTTVMGYNKEPVQS